MCLQGGPLSQERTAIARLKVAFAFVSLSMMLLSFLKILQHHAVICSMSAKATWLVGTWCALWW